jgi:hypothetical protein
LVFILIQSQDVVGFRPRKFSLLKKFDSQTLFQILEKIFSSLRMTDNKGPSVTTELNNEKKKNGRRRRTNKQKAEDQFDASAAPRTLEKFFSEPIEEQRENVDIELHLDIDERITDGYDDKIDAYLEMQPFDEAKTRKISTSRISDLEALTNIAIAKKLWTATPDSERTSVDHLKYLRTYDIILPKSVNVAIDHLGKVTDDEWICRIKWNALTIERYLFRGLQKSSHDKDFSDTYLVKIEDKDKFRHQDVSKLFNSSQQSVIWIREYAKNVLNDIMKKEFEVKIGTANDKIIVSYPRLEFSEDVDKDKLSIVAWMKKITVNHPDWQLALDAAILRLTDSEWLEKRKTKLSLLDPIFENTPWKDRTLTDTFKDTGINHIEDHKAVNLRDMCGSFLFHYQKVALPFYKRIINTSNAGSSSSFGSKAQLIVLNGPDNFETVKKRSRSVMNVSTGAEGSSYFRLKDKSSIVHQLTYGFTRAVSLRENYKYRTNGNPNAIKSTNISSDLRD